VLRNAVPVLWPTCDCLHAFYAQDQDADFYTFNVQYPCGISRNLNTRLWHQHGVEYQSFTYELEVCMGVGSPRESHGNGNSMMGMGMVMGIKPMGMGIAYISRV